MDQTNQKADIDVGNGARKQHIKAALAGCKQTKTMLVSEYFSLLKPLWDELDTYFPLPTCMCGNCTCQIGELYQHRPDEDRMHDFLFGINTELYGHVRSSLLAQDPLPTFDMAYHALLHEENLRSSTRNAVGDKVTERATKETVQHAELTNAKSGASQEVVAENFEKPSKKNKRKKRKSKKHMIDASLKVAKPSSTDKYFDLDERTLAMGIFIDTLKEERLKDDPDFTFTPEFYHAAKREFKSLNDDNRAMYIAKAKKRNYIEDTDVAASRVVRKALKIDNDSHDNGNIQDMAISLYQTAVIAERRKDDPDFTFGKIAKRPKNSFLVPFTYAELDPGFVFYQRLNDDDKVPFIAEAILRYLDDRVANLTQIVKRPLWLLM